MNIIGKTISAIAVSLCMGATMYAPDVEAAECSSEAAELQKAYQSYFVAAAKYGYDSPQVRAAERAISDAQVRYMVCLMPIGN